MARLLLVMPALPYPPQQGAALRNWGMLRALHEAEHELYLLCASGGEIAPELRARCAEIRCVEVPPRSKLRRLVEWLLSGRADLAERLRHSGLAHELDGLLARHRFDAAQVEGLEMTACLSALAANGVRLVYDAHNAEAALQASATRLARDPLLRAYSRSQAGRLARYEAELCAAVDEVIAVSREDAAELRALAPSAKIRVIPNAIDVATYAGERVEPPAPTLAFSGKMDYRPNVDAMLWFTREIWPKIRLQEPRAQLHIIGRAPAPAILDLAQDESVRVTGAVPEMRPHLLACSIYIAPLRMGSGTRLKLLEAMAAGCAILATPLAAAGLEGAGEAVALAEKADDFAQAALALLADSRRRAEMGRAARAFVAARYDWSLVAPLVRAVYE